MEKAVAGSSDQIADYLPGVAEPGIAEIRCDVWPKTPATIQAMKAVVEAVHRG